MTSPDIVAAIAPVIEAFGQLKIDYSIGGSVASSAHGRARATVDIDIVAALPADRVEGLVNALRSDYYIDRDAILDAIERRTMFNLVHLETMFKVDVYILTEREFDRESFHRRNLMSLADSGNADEYFLSTPEDIVLHKLEWFRLGGGVSERQWQDVVGVLRVQSEALDLDYMRRWADQLRVAELLERALVQAGLVRE